MNVACPGRPWQSVGARWLKWMATCLALHGCVAFGYGDLDVPRGQGADVEDGEVPEADGAARDGGGSPSEDGASSSLEAGVVDGGKGETGTPLDGAADAVADASHDALTEASPDAVVDATVDALVDAADSGDAPVCTPGAVRCEGEMAYTCSPEGDAETPQPCGADVPECQYASCVPGVGCKLEAAPDGTNCGDFEACQAGACEAVTNCTGECGTDCTQPRCDYSCQDSDDCSLACAEGQECNLDCDGGENCSGECKGELTDCNTGCVDAQACATSCTDGARCFTDCRGSSDCSVSCKAGASCMVDCRDADCDVECTGGSSCLVRCDPIDPFCNPGLTGCALCEDQTLACNAPCPASGAAWPPAVADWP